jgi:hypothetical protein
MIRVPLLLIAIVPGVEPEWGRESWLLACSQQKFASDTQSWKGRPFSPMEIYYLRAKVNGRRRLILTTFSQCVTPITLSKNGGRERLIRFQRTQTFSILTEV